MLSEKRILFGISGSFCNHAKILVQLKKLCEYNYVDVIITPTVKNNSTRFFQNTDFINQLQTITGHEILTTINDGEQIGPKNIYDLMVIAPATATICSKLVNGIYDNGLVLAAKAMIRNKKNIIIGFASNDGLGISGANIMRLMAMKYFYFIPYAQDAPIEKPCSIVADWTRLEDTIEEALNHNQIQPVLLGSL